MAKKIFFLGVVCALFLTVGCAHLAIKQEERPGGHEVWELQRLLAGVPRDWTYERHVFDCTNMTAYLYDYLTAKGYDCEIMIGSVYPWGFLTGHSHAWLIAEKDGKKFLIEPVDKKVASLRDFREYVLRINLGSLENARKFYRMIGFPHEWDY